MRTFGLLTAAMWFSDPRVRPQVTFKNMYNLYFVYRKPVYYKRLAIINKLQIQCF